MKKLYCYISSIEFTQVLLTLHFQSHLNDDRKGEILRGGVHTVIAGAPNAGKSSLLNILCK